MMRILPSSERSEKFLIRFGFLTINPLRQGLCSSFLLLSSQCWGRSQPAQSAAGKKDWGRKGWGRWARPVCCLFKVSEALPNSYHLTTIDCIPGRIPQTSHGSFPQVHTTTSEIAIIIPMLQMRRLSLRKVRQFVPKVIELLKWLCENSDSGPYGSGLPC